MNPELKHTGNSINRQALILILLFFPLIQAISQTGPGAMLPDKEDIPGWRPAGEVKVCDESSLGSIAPIDKNLILEYGFDQAVTGRYYNFKNRVIEIQIFTMDNSFGSCGLFMKNSKNLKVFREFGNSTYEKPGEFGFWKHFYFIRMTSAATGDTISEGYRQIAGFIDSKIKSRGEVPSILGYSKDRQGKVTIFKGPLALSEIYYFSPLNVFFVNEGVAIETESETEIIFRYSDNNEAVRRYTDAAGILGSMTKFTDFIMAGEYSFAMKDKDGKTLVFKVLDNCLHVTIK